MDEQRVAELLVKIREKEMASSYKRANVAGKVAIVDDVMHLTPFFLPAYLCRVVLVTVNFTY